MRARDGDRGIVPAVARRGTRHRAGHLPVSPLTPNLAEATMTDSAGPVGLWCSQPPPVRPEPWPDVQPQTSHVCLERPQLVLVQLRGWR